MRTKNSSLQTIHWYTIKCRWCLTPTRTITSILLQRTLQKKTRLTKYFNRSPIMNVIKTMDSFYIRVVWVQQNGTHQWILLYAIYIYIYILPPFIFYSTDILSVGSTNSAAPTRICSIICGCWNFIEQPMNRRAEFF